MMIYPWRRFCLLLRKGRGKCILGGQGEWRCSGSVRISDGVEDIRMRAVMDR
jgi:hypothetical protein